MSMHVEALAFKLWRDYITIMIQTSYFKYGGDNRRFLHRIQDKTVSFKDELSRLKEVTTILELALWKMKIIDHSLKENVTRLQKKINTDESSIRQQCREACGADVVIGCGCCKRKLAKRKLATAATRTIEELEEDTYWDDRGRKGVPPGMVPNLLDPHLRLSWHFLHGSLLRLRIVSVDIIIVVRDRTSNCSAFS